MRVTRGNTVRLEHIYTYSSVKGSVIGSVIKRSTLEKSYWERYEKVSYGTRYQQLANLGLILAFMFLILESRLTDS